MKKKVVVVITTRILEISRLYNANAIKNCYVTANDILINKNNISRNNYF